MLINALWTQKTACPFCRHWPSGLEGKNYRQGPEQGWKKIQAKALSSSCFHSVTEIPSFPTWRFLQVDLKFLVSPVLLFVGGISCIYVQNIHAGLQLCNYATFQPSSDIIHILNDMEFFLMLKRIPLVSLLIRLFQASYSVSNFTTLLRMSKDINTLSVVSYDFHCMKLSQNAVTSRCWEPTCVLWELGSLVRALCKVPFSKSTFVV